MAQAIIKAGICGLKTTVTAVSEDGITCELKIESECPAYNGLQEKMPEISCMDVFEKIGEGPIYETCKTVCRHGACPVPCGIIKAVEVAGGMALPGDVEIALSK